MVALAFAAAVMLFISPSPATAGINVGIQVGVPPPPVVVEHRWARPYPGAVWIGGHHEWTNGAWIWVGGFYGYPPRPGAYWVRARYRNRYYYPGHWAW
jgi:hypothetical protein